MKTLDQHIEFFVGEVPVIVSLLRGEKGNFWLIRPRKKCHRGLHFFAAVEQLERIFPGGGVYRVEEDQAKLDMGLDEHHIISEGIALCKQSWNGKTLAGLPDATASLIAHFLHTLQLHLRSNHFRQADGGLIQYQVFNTQAYLEIKTPADTGETDEPDEMNECRELWESMTDIDEGYPDEESFWMDDDSNCRWPDSCDCDECYAYAEALYLNDLDDEGQCRAPESCDCSDCVADQRAEELEDNIRRHIITKY